MSVKIKVIIKRPGVKPYATNISDSLENLQRTVDGYIETVTLAENLVLICNEEGRIRKLYEVVLNPAVLPAGMAPADYMRICFAMIDTADAVMFIPDWEQSEGAKLEHQYCKYIGKPVLYMN